MVNKVPFYKLNDIEIYESMESNLAGLVKELPTTNPADDVLSRHAFEVMQLCWKLDPVQRPKMFAAQQRYDIRMRPKNAR